MGSYYRFSPKLLQDALIIFRKDGLKAVIIHTWRYLFLYSIIAGPLQNLLGEILHEKLVRSVTIGYWPQIRNPQSFNEKVMYRKLFTDNELYSVVEDKWAVRDFVRNRVGEDCLLDDVIVTDDVSELELSALPNQFVIKATHGSGWYEIVEDKVEADLKELQQLSNFWLNQTYVPPANEYWYQEITPRVIIEPLLTNSEGNPPVDYKFFIFNSRVHFIQVDFDRHIDHKRRIFTPDWSPLPVRLRYPRGEIIEAPDQLDEMIDIAESLGDGFDHVRVDLYCTHDEGIVFGEMTVGHGSGGERFDPVEFDFKFGSRWLTEHIASSS